MKRIFLFSIILCSFFLSTLSVVSAQTTSTCTGELLVDMTAAQNCANLAETQGTALGYTIDCRVEQQSLGGFVDPNTGKDYILNTVCSVNGSPYQYGAYTLVGYTAGTGSTAIITSVNSGWDILQTDIQYSNAFLACGGQQPYGSVVNGQNVYSCTPPPGTVTTSTVPNTSSINSTVTGLTNLTKVLKSIILSSIYKPTQTVAQKAVSTFLGTTVPALGTPSAGTVGCYVFNTTLQYGSSGLDVVALTYALKYEGFLSSVRSDFDATVMTAVKAFQEAHATEILTIQGLTQGTGVVGPKTREYLNTHCLTPANITMSAVPATTPTPTPTTPPVTCTPSSVPTNSGIQNGKYRYTFTKASNGWTVTLNNPAYSVPTDAYYVPANFAFTATDALDLNRQNQGRFNYLSSLPGTAVGNTFYADMFGSFNNAYYDWNNMTQNATTTQTTCVTNTTTTQATQTGITVASNQYKYVKVSVADWDTLPIALREITLMGPNNTIVKPATVGATDFSVTSYLPPSNLTDGNENTIWSATKTSGSDLQVVTLDLGQYSALTQVKVMNYGLSYTRVFVIEVSKDGNTYTKIAEVRASQSAPVTDRGIITASVPQ